MKKIEMNIKSKRSIEEWEELAERYFEAQTTDAEEQELRVFLLSSEAVGEVFDEAKSVMGFLEVGKALHRNREKRKFVNYWKVAAVMCGVVIGASLWNIRNQMQDVCEAYIYGTKYTEVTLVMSQMRHSLDKVNYMEESNIVETQLGDFFQMMEEE